MTQAQCLLSSDESDWSSEQQLEIETLITDIEQLRDLVCITGSCYLLFVETLITDIEQLRDLVCITGSCLLFALCCYHRPM